MITQDYVRSRIYYDLLTGKIWWKPKGVPMWDNRFAGKEAGTIHRISARKYNYRVATVSIDYIKYTTHRLAWFYMLGEWPEEVDHEDHNPLNNSWINLVRSTRAQNSMNLKQRQDSTSGVTGVSWNTRDCVWRAYITTTGRTIHGGTFAQFKDAVARRKELELEHNFHPNHGK